MGSIDAAEKGLPISGISAEWEKFKEIRDHLRRDGTVLFAHDISECVKTAVVPHIHAFLHPLLVRMAEADGRPQPLVDPLRQEIASLYRTCSKSVDDDQDFPDDDEYDDDGELEGPEAEEAATVETASEPAPAGTPASAASAAAPTAKPAPAGNPPNGSTGTSGWRVVIRRRKAEIAVSKPSAVPEASSEAPAGCGLATDMTETLPMTTQQFDEAVEGAAPSPMASSSVDLTSEDRRAQYQRQTLPKESPTTSPPADALGIDAEKDGYEKNGEEVQRLKTNGALSLFFFANTELNDLP
eukprot:Skav209557  [mRNA]  locus=scaffold2497:469861:473546:- [translate_table: standard]